jgi:hypothetical protein
MLSFISKQFFILFILIISFNVNKCNEVNENKLPKGLSVKSPYFQYLPDCELNQRPPILKTTKLKGIVCPQVKDEIGFLSEWVGYYEMQGFNKIIIYDHNSSSPLDELQPWIDTGFVTIKREWYVNHTSYLTSGSKFKKVMAIKMIAEIDCKQAAVDAGIEIFVSVDLDEYLIPSSSKITVMDDLADWFEKTTRGYALLDKFNFPAAPHILEPINLLTIEAYQSHYSGAGKMNYYTTVMPKVALRLFNEKEYNHDTQVMLINCCDFHGCRNSRFYKNCSNLIHSEQWKLTGKHRPWRPSPKINHYGRTLEKYALKMQTWETASDGGGYDINNYLHRTLGNQFDDSAVIWGCQLRELLRKRTKQDHYIRPGDFWYRNPEFGKTVSDSAKRGRNGGAFGKQLYPNEFNPYPIGGTYQNGHKTYTPPPAPES